MTATADTRTGYFVVFAYGADSGQPQGVRETTVYLDGASRKSRRVRFAEIIGYGASLAVRHGAYVSREVPVRVLAFAPLDGLTRERADEVRARGVQLHA